MQDAFFSGVDQLEANIAGVKAKTPAFYRDARSFTGVFPARLLELRRVLPDRRFVPAQVLPGIGAVHLTAFEYHDTDIGPYNEFAVGILLNSPHFLQVPCYNTVRQLLENSFHTFIRHLPVTTQVAQGGGVELYNYPKFFASIDFTEAAGWVSCDVSQDGDRVCGIRGRKISAPRSGIHKYFCQLYQFQQPQSAEFKVNAREYGMEMGQDGLTLELGGSHPVARELSSLLISTNPLAYIYVPSMQAILYGPEHLSLAAIAFFMERGLGVDIAEPKKE